MGRLINTFGLGDVSTRRKQIREDCRGNEHPSNRKGPGAGVGGRIGGTEGNQCGWNGVRGCRE